MYNFVVYNATVDFFIVSWVRNKLLLRMNQSHPYQMSQNSIYDQLRVTFVNTHHFISRDLTKMIKQNYLVQKDIPPQVSSSTAENSQSAKLQEATESVNKSVTENIALSVILYLVLGFSMRKLWLKLNTVQLILHLPELRINYP